MQTNSLPMLRKLLKTHFEIRDTKNRFSDVSGEHSWGETFHVWRCCSTSGGGCESLCAPDLVSPPSARGKLWVCLWRNTLWSTWLCAWPDGPAATGSGDTLRQWVFPYKTFRWGNQVCSSNKCTPLLKFTHQGLLFRLLFMKVKAPSERPG